MKIHLLGDSLVQTGNAIFYSGWGKYLEAFLDQKVQVNNYSIGGRCLRSFLNEGRFCDFNNEKSFHLYQPALNEVDKDDYVCISFLCNDDDSVKNYAYRKMKNVRLGEPDLNGIYPVIEPKESMRVSISNWKEEYHEYLVSLGVEESEYQKIINTVEERFNQCGDRFYPYDCDATYKGYLKFYIDKIREKGAIAVLVIPGASRKFTEGKLSPIIGFFGGEDGYNKFRYVEAMKQLGRELDVPVVDLFEPTKSVYEILGEELSGYLHNIQIAPDDIAEIDAAVYKGECVDDEKWCREYNLRRKNRNFLSIDNTHLNHFGAFFHAALVADRLYRMGILVDSILDTPRRYVEVPEKLSDKKILFESHLKYVNLWKRKDDNVKENNLY